MVGSCASPIEPWMQLQGYKPPAEQLKRTGKIQFFHCMATRAWKIFRFENFRNSSWLSGELEALTRVGTGPQRSTKTTAFSWCSFFCVGQVLHYPDLEDLHIAREGVAINPCIPEVA